MPITTTTSPAAWRPDLAAYPPADAVPTALILTASTVVGSIEGDAPAVRVPFVRDDGTAIVAAEATEIVDAQQQFDETVVQTSKVAALGRYSFESLEQPEAARLALESLQRSVIHKADALFLGSDTSPTGLLHTSGITDAGTVDSDLDTIVDAVASIESNGGAATNIIAAPTTWAALSKLKASTGSNQMLIGTDVTQPGTRQLLGIPVNVTAQMPEGKLLIVDRGTVISAAGQVRLARSDDAYFAHDIAAVRVAWRIGWAVQRPDRIAKLTIT